MQGSLKCRHSVHPLQYNNNNSSKESENVPSHYYYYYIYYTERQHTTHTPKNNESTSIQLKNKSTQIKKLCKSPFKSWPQSTFNLRKRSHPHYRDCFSDPLHLCSVYVRIEINALQIYHLMMTICEHIHPKLSTGGRLFVKSCWGCTLMGGCNGCDSIGWERLGDSRCNGLLDSGTDCTRSFSLQYIPHFRSPFRTLF